MSTPPSATPGDDSELVRDERTGRMVACPKPRSVRDLADAARRILEAQKQIPPAERFRRMVETGLIDEEGRLRKKFGGDVP